MKMLAAAVAAAVVVPLVTMIPARASAPAPEPSDAQLAKATDRPGQSREQFYFVMPDRFANGDRANDAGGLTGGRLTTGYDPTDPGFYHGGDLQGVIDRLTYIKGLGTTAIWLAPVFKNNPVQGTGANASAGYHGYWITDFTQVDPHFGTNEQLNALIANAHRMGMKVYFDIITNHTADVAQNTENTYDYRSKASAPYLDASGTPFDDAQYADGSRPFPAVDAASFPYAPTVPAGQQHAKKPDWLNDVTMYHNRGNSTFAGESGSYGDFYGLDDLFTERPEVVKGMEDIYDTWIRKTGADGFRIDTVKNVDMPFWQQFIPQITEYARDHGKPDFFSFGEVYDSAPATTSSYVTQGKLQATLDFPFQNAAREYVSQGASARTLSQLFAADADYNAASSNAYELPTFLGNHDMGRIGSFLTSDNPKASAAELLQRDVLANQLMFLTRGQPVVYYGDEQGFTGSGGDKAARQDMFASQTPSYISDPQIGTARTDAADEFDPTHPLYQTIAGLSQLTKDNPALRNGVQVERYAADGPGVYAFSRTDAKQQVEYVVAVNNATTDQTVSIPTYSSGMTFDRIYPNAGPKPTTGPDGKLAVDVPALSAVVFKAEARLAAPSTAPSVTVDAPAAGATGLVSVGATVPGSGLAKVAFAAQIGSGSWQTIGVADHAPYRVSQDLSKVAAGTPVRYKAVVVDSAGATAHAYGTTTVGAVPPPQPPQAVNRAYAVVHYKRPDGDYQGWNLYTWGDIDPSQQAPWPAGQPFTGVDAYGAFAWVKLKPGATDVGFIVENNGVKDVPDDRHIDLTKTGEVWLTQGDASLATSPPSPYPPVPANTAILHYHRADGNYAGWGLHDWTGAANPTSWTSPLQPSGQDSYGPVFTVPLAAGATSLSYILHNGDTKDLPGDQSLSFSASGREVWILSGQEGYLLPEPSGSALDADLSKAKAQWIDQSTVAWKEPVDPALHQELVYAPDGGISILNGDLSQPGHWLRLEPVPGGLTAAQLAAHPNLAGYSAFSIDPRDRDRIGDALSSQVIATQRNAAGALLAATGVQMAGALDDRYAHAAAAAKLGPVFDDGRPRLAVWAPTAKDVALELYDDAKTTTKPQVVSMHRDAASGVWSAPIRADWKGKYYLYRVTVWAPSVQRVVVNHVTDPYSLSLSADSSRSQIVDLSDRRLTPQGWSSVTNPAPAVPKQIQELHVRDFSAADSTVPAADRGTYLAFTDTGSDGSQHLRALAQSGVTHVHLLPVFDFSSVPELASEQQSPPCDLTSYGPASDQQQACLTRVQGKTAYNWGYDPWHYTTPEGSYSTDPDGGARIGQFRRMVQAINGDGLGVIMDVVYNHTSAAGEDPHSVLDQIVPGYYQRLLADGTIATSTCCAGTAPEHTMMNKLVVDSVVTWAEQYKVDGFRFDLMGHMPKSTMLDVRAALDALTPAKDGVDGKKIYLYGEGWNFGEVANNAYFVQATQANMAGTGIGTFNDRVRDAVRGGGPFDADPRIQGFSSGLFTDPNGDSVNGTPAQQRAALLHDQDLIKVGLTGNLKGFSFTDSAGRKVTGSEVDYNGSPAGYADDPADSITYVDAHDNETLYDALTYKLPQSTSAADRSRMQVVALATTALSQSPGFVQAGSDLLRSKSFDGNSYDSGDWFNDIHWNCADGNGFGRGLPPAASDSGKWSYMTPLLQDSALRPDCTATTATSAAYQDLTRIAASSPLFSLGTGAAVQRGVTFPLSGTDETPGVVTMHLTGADPHWKSITVVFNATPTTQTQKVDSLRGASVALHPIQAGGADPVVKQAGFDAATGTLSVPGRTVAVFVQS